MSTQRAQKGGWVFGGLPTGANGRPLCRRCAIEIPLGRRKTFCSSECVHEWKLRTNPGYLREQVFRRDLGICAKCSLDTMADVKRKRTRGTGDLWQADHIKPVVEGGGECGIDNLRTLCTACHKSATKELAARRAAERKPQLIFSL